MYFFISHYRKHMEFKGKDGRGVPLWVGKVDIPQRRVCSFLLLFGLIILEGTIRRFLHSLPTDDPMNGTLRFVRMCTGGAMAYFSIQLWTLRRQMLRLRSADTVAAQLGLDAAQLAEMTRERNIKPRCNVNGRDFYDLKDFGEAGTLLRGSSAPGAPPDILLRAAIEENETKSETLLRATAGEANGESR